MFAKLLMEPGLGGLIVLTVLVLSVSFYGSLILWIARTKPTPSKEKVQVTQPEPHYDERLEGVRS